MMIAVHTFVCCVFLIEFCEYTTVSAAAKRGGAFGARRGCGTNDTNPVLRGKICERFKYYLGVYG